MSTDKDEYIFLKCADFYEFLHKKVNNHFNDNKLKSLNHEQLHEFLQRSLESISNMHAEFNKHWRKLVLPK